MMSGEGNIYLIACEHPFAVKIGYTRRHPKTRLQQLQTGSPSKLALLGWFAGNLGDEKELHNRFSEHRLAGEWFHLCPENQNDYADIFNIIQINNILHGHEPQ